MLKLRHDVDTAISVIDRDVELFHYTYCPDTAPVESPKPYLHPIRTRTGRLVSLFRPHDHVWHKGIALSLPNVGDENFWGGPTYVRGRNYVQLPNNGTQLHRRISELGVSDATAVFAHELDWITEAGQLILTEHRRICAAALSDGAWALSLETALTNVSGQPIAFGSPTTRGRENAGYGGLFWRGPRSFTGGQLVTAQGAGGDELRGTRHEWMAFVGRHDNEDASSIVLMLDDATNPQHPPQWFGRSEMFACLNPAPFFSEEVTLPDGETLRLRYGVGVADGTAQDAAALADQVRAFLATTANRGAQA